jgi:hypothetical protein
MKSLEKDLEIKGVIYFNYVDHVWICRLWTDTYKSSAPIYKDEDVYKVLDYMSPKLIQRTKKSGIPFEILIDPKKIKEFFPRAVEKLIALSKQECRND